MNYATGIRDDGTESLPAHVDFAIRQKLIVIREAQNRRQSEGTIEDTPMDTTAPQGPIMAYPKAMNNKDRDLQVLAAKGGSEVAQSIYTDFSPTQMPGMMECTHKPEWLVGYQMKTGFGFRCDGCRTKWWRSMGGTLTVTSGVRRWRRPVPIEV